MYDLPDDYPHQDLDSSERYLRTQEPLLLTTAGMIFFAAVKAKALDLDVREGVAALINERRGLPVGCLGESAAVLKEEFESRFATFSSAALAEGMAFTDHDVLRILAFFQREEMHTNNRRPKSRAYIDWLRSWVSQMAAGMEAAAEDGDLTST